MKAKPVVLSNRASRLRELIGSLTLHASGSVRGVSVERPLNTSNKMADKRNVLVASNFCSLVAPAAAFQCLGLLFSALLSRQPEPFN